jgi:hypothetical protein
LEETKMNSTTSGVIKEDWTKPAAMAIPKGGYSPDQMEQGRYGPIFPKTPACYGFTIIAKLIPGGEEACYRHAKTIEEAVAKDPNCLAVLKLHYLRWQIFQINGESFFQYQGIFDTDFDKYTEDAVTLFSATGIDTVFENLEGFPKVWKTRPEGFVKFVREHQCPSFLEYGGISLCECRRDQDGAEAQGRLLKHARPDAMTREQRIIGRNLREQPHHSAPVSGFLSACERQRIREGRR